MVSLGKVPFSSKSDVFPPYYERGLSLTSLFYLFILEQIIFEGIGGAPACSSDERG